MYFFSFCFRWSFCLVFHFLDFTPIPMTIRKTFNAFTQNDAHNRILIFLAGECEIEYVIRDRDNWQSWLHALNTQIRNWINSGQLFILFIEDESSIMSLTTLWRFQRSIFLTSSCLTHIFFDRHLFGLHLYCCRARPFRVSMNELHTEFIIINIRCVIFSDEQVQIFACGINVYSLIKYISHISQAHIERTSHIVWIIRLVFGIEHYTAVYKPITQCIKHITDIFELKIAWIPLKKWDLKFFKSNLKFWATIF